MFKKFFLTMAAAIVFAVALVAAPRVSSCYAIRCYKCEEYARKHIDHGYVNNGSIAERRFECEKKGDYTFVYKCKYGHVLYIDTKTGERR